MCATDVVIRNEFIFSAINIRGVHLYLKWNENNSGETAAAVIAMLWQVHGSWQKCLWHAFAVNNGFQPFLRYNRPFHQHLNLSLSQVIWARTPNYLLMHSISIFSFFRFAFIHVIRFFSSTWRVQTVADSQRFDIYWHELKTHTRQTSKLHVACAELYRNFGNLHIQFCTITRTQCVECRLHRRVCGHAMSIEVLHRHRHLSDVIFLFSSFRSPKLKQNV